MADQPVEVPQQVIELVEDLMPRLLAGEGPVIEALRNQYGHVSACEVEFTGTGFLVSFTVPYGVPRVQPRDFAGGDATIRLSGPCPVAGCALLVHGGALSSLDVYSQNGEWSNDFRVLGTDDVMPLVPPSAAVAGQDEA